MPYESLLVGIEERVATLTVNRPERRNALSAVVRAELADALAALRDEPEVRVVVITGAGDRAFVAGADITEFAERTALEQRQVMGPPRIFELVAEYPKPVIAMINGLALGGGCELALACDLRIAAESARLGQPEIRLGLIPGGGGTQRLPRLVGAGRALRLILTGEPIDAHEALRMGLVDEVVPDDALRARTLELARAVAGQPPLAVRLAKQAVRAALEQPLASGLAYERELFITAFGSEDKTEGVAAFLEKRPPVWKGR